MTLLRRLAPALSTLLVALVAVQTLDLVACADEAEAAGHAGGSHVDGVAAAGAHPLPAPGADHDEGAPHGEPLGMVDCLCHVVFVSTAVAPMLGPPAEVAFAFAAYRGAGAEGEVPPPGHVPLG